MHADRSVGRFRKRTCGDVAYSLPRTFVDPGRFHHVLWKPCDTWLPEGDSDGSVCRGLAASGPAEPHLVLPHVGTKRPKSVASGPITRSRKRPPTKAASRRFAPIIAGQLSGATPRQGIPDRTTYSGVTGGFLLIRFRAGILQKAEVRAQHQDRQPPARACPEDGQWPCHP